MTRLRRNKKRYDQNIKKKRSKLGYKSRGYFPWGFGSISQYRFGKSCLPGS